VAPQLREVRGVQSPGGSARAGGVGAPVRLEGERRQEPSPAGKGG
jgi:hypothetical protein